MVKLFDVQNEKVIPTEHCYVVKQFKNIMDNYEDNHLKIYAYIFYMTCPNPDLNVYFDMPEDTKEETILHDVEADFNIDDKLIVEGLEKAKEMYDTPMFRAYRGIKAMLDKLAMYMENTPISHGRDGNINSLITAAKNFEDIRASFKGAYKDLQEEQSHYRGNAGMAYDQR